MENVFKHSTTVKDEIFLLLLSIPTAADNLDRFQTTSMRAAESANKTKDQTVRKARLESWHTRYLIMIQYTQTKQGEERRFMI